MPLFFNKLRWWSSELFLYSIFTQHAGNKPTVEPAPNVTFWNTERPLDTKTIADIYTWPNIKMFGLHRHVLTNKTDLSDFINFLTGIGFNKNLVETMLKQYEQDIKI